MRNNSKYIYCPLTLITALYIWILWYGNNSVVTNTVFVKIEMFLKQFCASLIFCKTFFYFNFSTFVMALLGKRYSFILTVMNFK